MEVKKSKDADIDKQRRSLIMIGLIFGLGFILTAFEYQVFEKKVLVDMTIDNNDLVDEEILDVPPPPPPVAPPPPPIMTEIKVVENDVKVDQNQVIVETPIDEKVEIVEVKVPDEPVVEEIFTVVETQAEFPGGMPEMYKFIGANVKYPPMAKESGVQGKVFVKFVVEKDGSIANVTVLRGIGSGCDEEAVRVVKMMPKWTPAKQRGKVVRCYFNLPINFKLG